MKLLKNLSVLEVSILVKELFDALDDCASTLESSDVQQSVEILEKCEQLGIGTSNFLPHFRAMFPK